MSHKLAEILDVKVGEAIDLELLEGDRRTVRVTVSTLLDDVFGLSLHASLETLRRLLDEQGNVTSVLLTVDPRADRALLTRLSEIPRVLSIARRTEVMDKFHEQTRYMWTTMLDPHHDGCDHRVRSRLQPGAHRTRHAIP